VHRIFVRHNGHPDEIFKEIVGLVAELMSLTQSGRRPCLIGLPIRTQKPEHINRYSYGGFPLVHFR